MRSIRTFALPLAVVIALVAAGCGSNSDGSAEVSGGTGSSATSNETIHIVGFAVPEAANTSIAEAWARTPEGKGVKFVTSYGASGDQSRAVESGLKADYVHFSQEGDVTRLVDEGLVAKDWNQGPNRGVVSSSVVVFGVRKGNPKNIHTWDDLIQPGIKIVTPNPTSSGSARWNALAAWGQVIKAGGTEAEAEKYLRAFFGNVVSLPSSGRDATTAFLGGVGDVFMSYENEVILARQNGEAIDYVVPDTTLRIDNPGAVLINATPKSSEWLDFVLSADGQRQFAIRGFRPIVDGVKVDEVKGANDPSNPFPEVPNLMTIGDDFSSWSEAAEKFFAEKTGLVAIIIAESGKAE